MGNFDLTVYQEKLQRLAELEGDAAAHLKSSRELFDRAILNIQTIRQEELWKLAVDEHGVRLGDYKAPRWESYITIFCTKYGTSRSSIFDHLQTVETWVALGLPQEQIADERVGVVAAGAIKEIVHVDGRSGELILPPQEVIDRLPGDPSLPPAGRVIAKIQEVFFDPPEPLKPGDIKKSFAVDAAGKPDLELFETKDGDIWFVYSDVGDVYYDGKLILAKNYRALPPVVKAAIAKRFNIRTFDRKDGDK